MNTDPLNLRELPASAPPADLWPAIETSLDRAARGRTRRNFSKAVAAALALAVIATAIVDSVDERAADAVAEATELQQARAESARLEQVLRRQRDGLLDATSVESLAWMEQEVGWLDVQLADSPSDTRLWQQRADLLAEMASRYERNNWQVELQLASY